MTGEDLESLAEALGPKGHLWWMPACLRCGQRCMSQREFIDEHEELRGTRFEDKFNARYWTLCSGCDSALDEVRGEMQASWKELGLWNGEMNGMLVELDWDEQAEEWERSRCR
jgi:hypothetical protein